MPDPAPFFHLKNLGTSGCVEGVWPWQWTTRPEEVYRTDKKRRDVWISSPTTQHHVYGVAFGMNPRQRVSKTTRAGEGNPPHSVWGLAADFDSPYEVGDVMSRIPEHSRPWVPQWYERTLSGNARLVWVFERPVLMPGFAFTQAFLTMATERLRVSHLLAGLDFKATTNPSRYFTNAGEWYAIPGGVVVPTDAVEGWVVETGRSFRFDRDGDTRGDTIGNLDALRDALATRYPRFAEWPGDFVEGAMGPTFWVDGSASPKSATVRAGGMQTFSAHASKAFFTWSDLLDGVVVQGLQSESLGAAVRDLYYDGQLYWVPDKATGSWRTLGPANMDTYLILRRGCSRKAQESGVSKLDEAKLHIAENQYVPNVGHAVCFPTGLIRGADGQPLLNISTRTVLAPTEDRGMIWGPTGQFPFISGFYDAFIATEEARIALLGWLSYAYAGAYARKPAPGQSIFLAGSPGVGKSMHTSAILSPLLGGCADAGPYIHGKDSFGGELFESFLLRSDDNAMFADARTRNTTSERVKSLVANPEQRVHVKFRMPMLSLWTGRLVCTTNCDPDSLSILPELTSSLEGKISFFRASDIPYEKLALGREYILATTQAELPYFARWLLEHPPKALGAKLDSRFGVAAYHDPSLLVESRAQAGSAVVRDLLDDWRKEVDDKPQTWRGTVAHLRMAMALNAGRNEMLRMVPMDRFRRDVQKIASSGLSWIRTEGEFFVIDRPLTKPAASATLPPPPAQLADSKYGKTQ